MSSTAPREPKKKKSIHDLFPNGIGHDELKALLPCQGCHYSRKGGYGVDCKVINRCAAAQWWGVSPPTQLRWVESTCRNMFTNQDEVVRHLRCSRFTPIGSKPRKAKQKRVRVIEGQLSLFQEAL